MRYGGGSCVGESTISQTTEKPEPRITSFFEWCAYRISPGCSSITGFGSTSATATPSSPANVAKSFLALQRMASSFSEPTGQRAFLPSPSVIKSSVILVGVQVLTVNVDFWSTSGENLNSRSPGAAFLVPSQNLAPSIVNFLSPLVAGFWYTVCVVTVRVTVIALEDLASSTILARAQGFSSEISGHGPAPVSRAVHSSTASCTDGDQLLPSWSHRRMCVSLNATKT
mmetsp:Transcript_5337/g.16818  ORF Transcript_5337/g.16818 Transcript_5337/m.16818 type:complete len:227 (+) Transcript_5337:611-1291(+)